MLDEKATKEGPLRAELAINFGVIYFMLRTSWVQEGHKITKHTRCTIKLPEVDEFWAPGIYIFQALNKSRSLSWIKNSENLN